jgi:DNA-binding beta-propeller fold protein YncE
MPSNKIALCFMLYLSPALATGQVVGVALDPKPVLVDGEASVVASPPADSAVFFEFSGTKRMLLGKVSVPTSFQGPPSAIAITADRSLALVSASSRIDPEDPKTFAADYRLSVVDLASRPIRVVQTITLDASPSSVAINPAGTMALAMHNGDDSITVLSIAAGHAKVVEKLSLGKGLGPMASAFGPDGHSALISFPNGGKVGIFAVADGRLKMPAIREMSAGIWPTAVSYCGNTGFAVVSNYGKVTGDLDTISLIDVAAAIPRVVDTVTVGPAPEGVACSPDGRYAAAAVQNMSTVPKSNPLYSPTSLLVLMKIEGKRLLHIDDAPFGAWAQGVGFLDDSRTLFAQSIVDRSMHLFRIESDGLKIAAPPIVFENGAPVSFGISGR